MFSGIAACPLTARLLKRYARVAVPGYVQLAEALLGHVMVAEDLRAALAASNLNGYGTVFVTREGDLLWPDRFISGGSGEHAGDGHHDSQNGRPSVEAARLALAQAEAEHEALALRFEEERAAHRRVNEELEAARGRAAEAEHAAAAARADVAVRRDPGRARPAVRAPGQPDLLAGENT